jgi:hypothetical protein
VVVVVVCLYVPSTILSNRVLNHPKYRFGGIPGTTDSAVVGKEQNNPALAEMASIQDLDTATVWVVEDAVLKDVTTDCCFF